MHALRRRLLSLLFFVSGSCLATLLAAADLPSNPAASKLHDLAGRIEGKVFVARTVSESRPLPVFKNRKFCGATVANETLLIDSSGGVRNAVVLLRPVATTPAPPPEYLTLDNKNCRFVPHVQIATVGSELAMKNSDSILHTVHARMETETLFNVGLPTWRKVNKRLDRTGVVRINCDVLHTWMSAAIVVTDTPYFALTDESGGFKVEGLPSGNYELDVWHERLGVRRQFVAVESKSIRRIEVIYSGAKIR